jgi:hypothetical protein
MEKIEKRVDSAVSMASFFVSIRALRYRLFSVSYSHF